MTTIRFLTSALLANLATPSSAACVVQTDDGAKIVVCQTKSAQGKTLSVTMEGKTVSTGTDHAVFCSTPTATLSAAILWMPAHNHGSIPTTLSAAPDHCTRIDDIDFSMPGTWEIRLRLGDGDRGVVAVDVAAE